MNFKAMHDQLRRELLRRIERGTLSASLLSRQTGFGLSHISNYLHGRGQLSMDAVDRVLAALHLSVSDLLTMSQPRSRLDDGYGGSVPLVSHHAALFEPYIRVVPGQELLHVPNRFLEGLRAHAPSPRRAWERFVAVRISPADALPMEPLVYPHAIALIDRHYNSLVPYRPDRRNFYALRNGVGLQLRYIDFIDHRLVLRPHSLAFPIGLLDVDPGESPGDLIGGRVAVVWNET